jgi:hypothetical protein
LKSPRQLPGHACFGLHPGSLIPKIALFCGLAFLVTTTGGCFMAAFALAPVAVQLVKAAGRGISSASKSTKTVAADDSEVCDLGGRQFPPLIELRTDKMGTTLYRPFTPSVVQSDPEMAAIVGRSGNSGWKLAGKFTTMNFQPPLRYVLLPSSVTYLAYAPAEPRDPAEHLQLEALNQDFGQNTGTFDWNDRSYRYATAHQLPCAPPPAATARRE